MALLEEDNQPALDRSEFDAPRICVWTHHDGKSTIELDLTHAQARAVLPALASYLRDLCGSGWCLS